MSNGKQPLEPGTVAFNKRVQELRERHRLIKSKSRAKNWDRKHKEWYEDTANWARSHPDNVRIIHANHKARLAGAEGSFSYEEFKEKCRQQEYKCTYCHKEYDLLDLEPDHIIPISKGGANYISNIAPACRSCNASKGSRLLDSNLL